MLHLLSFIQDFTTLQVLLFMFWSFCIIGFYSVITYSLVMGIKSLIWKS
jgi:hypothetical protein